MRLPILLIFVLLFGGCAAIDPTEPASPPLDNFVPGDDDDDDDDDGTHSSEVELDVDTVLIETHD